MKRLAPQLLRVYLVDLSDDKFMNGPMKETTDYIDNIMDIVLACRTKNKMIGARLKHFYSDKETIVVKLTGNAQITLPVLIAENGVSQMTKEAIQRIADSFQLQ